MPFHPDKLDPQLWQVVRALDGDLSRLHDAVTLLNRGRLMRLSWNFERAANELTGPPWTPAEADFHYAEGVGAWVVSQGEDFYRQVYDDPSMMPAEYPPGARIVSLVGELNFLFKDRVGVYLPPMPPGWLE